MLQFGQEAKVIVTNLRVGTGYSLFVEGPTVDHQVLARWRRVFNVPITARACARAAPLREVEASVVGTVACLLERGNVTCSILEDVSHSLVEVLIMHVDLSLAIDDQLLLATVQIVDVLHFGVSDLVLRLTGNGGLRRAGDIIKTSMVAGVQLLLPLLDAVTVEDGL